MNGPGGSTEQITTSQILDTHLLVASLESACLLVQQLQLSLVCQAGIGCIIMLCSQHVGDALNLGSDLQDKCAT